MQILSTLVLFVLVNGLAVEAKSINAVQWDNSAHSLTRHRRYLGLSKKYKLNKRYQECVAPGDVQGHCKHAVFCPIDVLRTSKNHLDSLCVIEKSFVGVCCPDDVLLSKVHGSDVIMDLPASGSDYNDEDANTGCGLNKMATLPDLHSTVKRWPWIAALYKDDSPYEQFCGGVLITDQHILTASHCLEGLNLKHIRVRLGEYDFTKLSETRSKDFSLKHMIMHQDYDPNTYENDVAILKLSEATAFSSYIWPICLPPVEETFENETAYVAGWGQVSHGGPTSELLLEVSVPIWEQQKCVDAYAQRIRENFLCAAGFEGNRDSCKGDSGGPLLFQLKNGRWVTIGVVSWGIGCGDIGKPGVYVRVNRYLPWIIKQTLLK